MLFHGVVLFVWTFPYICIYRCWFNIVQVHVHLKRHLMRDLPTKDEDVAQWCKNAFVAKVRHSYLLMLIFHTFCIKWKTSCTLQPGCAVRQAYCWGFLWWETTRHWAPGEVASGYITSALLSHLVKHIIPIEQYWIWYCVTTGSHFLGSFAHLGGFESHPMFLSLILMERRHIFGHFFGSRHRSHASLDSVLTVGAIHPCKGCAVCKREELFTAKTRKTAVSVMYYSVFICSSLDFPIAWGWHAWYIIKLKSRRLFEYLLIKIPFG